MRLLVLMFSLIASVNCLAQLTAVEQDLISRCKAGTMPSAYNYRVWLIAKGMLKDSPFKSRININNGFLDKYINVFIVDSTFTNTFPKFECQCAVIKNTNNIVCDQKLFKHFAVRLDIGAGDSSESINHLTNSRFEFFLLQWLIGHEIGHIMLRNGKAKSDDLSARNFEYSKEEQKVDEYVVRQVKDPNDHFWMYLGFSNLISRSFENTLLSWYTRTEIEKNEPLIIKYKRGTHPPWLLRFLNMAETVVDQTDVIDESGYFPYLRHRLVLTETDDIVDDPMLCNKKFEASQQQLSSLKDLTTDSVGYDWHYKYGIEQFEMGNYSDASNEFRACIEIIDTLDSQTERRKYHQQANMWLAKIALVNSDFSAANSSLGKVYQPKTLENYGSYCLIAGLTHFGRNQLDSALCYFSKVLEIDSTFDEALLGMGLAYYKLGKADIAASFIQRAYCTKTEIHRTQYLLYDRLWPHKVVYYFDSIRNATRILQETIRLSEHPELLNFKSKIADNFYRTGDFEHARSEIQEILRFIEKRPDVLSKDQISALSNFEGMIYNALNKPDSAIDSYRSALQMRKNDTSDEGLFYKGQTLYNIGNLFYKRFSAIDSAVSNYKSAINVYNSIRVNISRFHLSETIKCYNNLGLLQLELSKFNDFVYTREETLRKMKILYDEELFENIIDVVNGDLITLFNLIDETKGQSDPRIAFGLEYIKYFEKLEANSDSLNLKFKKEFSDYWAMVLSNYQMRLMVKGERLLKMIGQENDDQKKYSYLSDAIELNKLVLPRTDSLQLVLSELYNRASNFAPNYNDKIKLTRESIKLKEALQKNNHAEDLRKSTSQMYGNLGWYYLLTREFSQALSASKRGLQIYPKNEWINANLALGYLFNGKERKALRIYSFFKDKSQDYNKTYRTVFLDDIETLEEHEIYHEKFYDIVLLVTNRMN